MKRSTLIFGNLTHSNILQQLNLLSHLDTRIHIRIRQNSDSSDIHWPPSLFFHTIHIATQLDEPNNMKPILLGYLQ